MTQQTGVMAARSLAGRAYVLTSWTVFTIRKHLERARGSILRQSQERIKCRARLWF